MHAHCALACLNIFYKASLLRMVSTLTPVPRSVSSPETESGDNCLCGCQARAECDQWPMAPGGDCQGWHTPATSSQASARPRQVSRTAECRAIYYTQVNNQANRSHFFDYQSRHVIVSSVVATVVHYYNFTLPLLIPGKDETCAV